MSEMNNLIQWPRAQYWDKPWNPIVGCHKISPACDNCYAETLTARFKCSDFKPHLTKQQFPPTTKVVFCGNMTDLFGSWVNRPYLHFCAVHGAQYRQGKKSTATYLWLTKRVENMCAAMDELDYSDPLWDRHYFGFTAENEDYYQERLQSWKSSGKYRSFNGWLSAEPLLGEIDLRLYEQQADIFKWVVVGCESGPNRRPCEIEWVESIVEQCQNRNVPVFVKQLDLDGKCERDITKFPAHLRIRQVPWAKEGGSEK